MKRILILFLCIILSYPFSNSYAGDLKAAGTVLDIDSYVFTIEEATALKNRISELEKMELELLKYRELEIVRLQQIDFYILNEGFYLTQIDRYKDMDLLSQGLLDKYRKRDRMQTIENIGFLSLGVALTIASFLLADSATDLARVTIP